MPTHLTTASPPSSSARRAHRAPATPPLRLGEGLAVPVGAVAHTIALVGQKRTGKTSTAVVIVEEAAAAAGACFAVMDPTGAWAGLSSSADGSGPGLDCVVMGGPTGDVPLAPTAGKVVAHLVIDEGYSVVCNLKGMVRRDQITFVADFSEEALHLGRRRAVTIVFDEAPRFVPQAGARLEADGPRCRMAVTELVALGGAQGLGSIVIATRPSALHKDVLEEAEVLITHRLMGPNDRRAVAIWLENADGSAAMLEALPNLPQGRALVLAPEYAIVGAFDIRPKRTFDSSDSPLVGAVLVNSPARGRAVDLGALRAKMGDALRAAEENDPVALKRRIAALEAAARKSGPGGGEALDPDGANAAAAEEARALTAELGSILGLAGPVDAATVRAATAATVAEGRRLLAALRSAERDFAPAVDALTETLTGLSAVAKGAAVNSAPITEHPGRVPPVSVLPARSVSPAGAPGPRTPQLRILDAIAALESIGIPVPSKVQVALFASRSPRSSGYTNSLGALRTAGLVSYPRPGAVALTDAGRAYADSSAAPSTADEMHAYVRDLVGPARARILDQVIAAHPGPLSKVELADRAGVSARSSGYTNNLGKLRSLGLIEYPAAGYVRGAPVLFLGRA